MVRSWPRPAQVWLGGNRPAPKIFHADAGRPRAIPHCDGRVRLYVCGITPYDATHLGHARTYLAFDTLTRVLLDSGLKVSCVQNLTDVDDPLLERAAKLGRDWKELAAEQTELFRQDMTALNIIPPDRYMAVSECIESIAAAVDSLMERGLAYRLGVESGHRDIYFDLARAASSTGWQVGRGLGLGHPGWPEIAQALEQGESSVLERLVELFAQRGGDPARSGKISPLDPILWRAARPGEPSWDTVVGSGRPGWHIECSVIALADFPEGITLQAGGSDLIFPHHDYTALMARTLSGRPFTRGFVHAGQVAYAGRKMSKSLGNLVLVSDLRRKYSGSVIRLALLARHYRQDWEFFAPQLEEAKGRLELWLSGAGTANDGDEEAVFGLRQSLANDLDTPSALRLVDGWAAAGRLTPLRRRAVCGLLGVDPGL